LPKTQNDPLKEVYCRSWKRFQTFMDVSLGLCLV